MKTHLAFVLIVLCALALEPVAFAGRGGGHQGGGGGGHRGGGGGQKVSRPSGGSGNYRPSGGGHKPQVSRPSGGGSRVPASRPAQRPQAKPQRPSGSAGTANVSVDRPKPQTRPAQVARPQGGDDFVGMRPDRPANRPEVSRPQTKRPEVNRPQVDRPSPTNRPDIANRPDRNPGIANRPGADRPARPDLGNRPGLGDNRSNLDSRPDKPARPERPSRPDRWQNIENSNANQWNKWRQDNSAHINNFEVNRTNNWNHINARYKERGWASHYGSADYRRWRGDVRNFRIGRGWEIWDQRRPFWNNCFDNHWWGSCWWRPRPFVPIGVAMSPWWWWRPFVWTSVGAFFGTTIASQPIIYDPGTTALYEGDTYYEDGQAVSSAAEAREAADELANPEIAETPVPEPAAEGQPEE
jgi:hypothetical protein